jgi:hypothetical protein
MASTLTRWFVVASPTGSTASEFFESASISDAGDFNANFNNLNSILGGGPIVDWGTSGAFPTYSAYSPGIYIRDYEGNSYTSSIYQYIDSDDVTLVTSIQQDLQKIFFPGIVTGSSAYGFGGKLVTTSSSAPAGSALSGSIGFQSSGGSNFVNFVTMSLAANSFNRVNFASFFSLVNSSYRIVFRDFQSSAEAVFDIDSPYDPAVLIDNSFYSWAVTYVSSTGTPVLNNSSSITFVDEASNQQTFYIVGVANPASGLPFAGQSTVGTADAAGDFRSGIIKVYATESNNTSDWVSLIRTVTGDNNATWDPVSANGPSYVAANHNLFMFTASAGSAGTGSWELLVDGA